MLRKPWNIIGFISHVLIYIPLNPFISHYSMKQWSWLEGCFHDRARWRCQSLCAPCVARTWSSRDQGLASVPGWSVMQAFGFIGRSHVLGSITNFLACSTIANACFGNCGWSTLFWFPGAPGRSQSHASEWRKVCRQHAWFWEICWLSTIGFRPAILYRLARLVRSCRFHFQLLVSRCNGCLFRHTTSCSA